MNRLIIVGNGFDLAHGMKTSYADFIHYYVNKILNECRSTNKAYSDACFVMKGNPHAATDMERFLNDEEITISDFDDFLVDNSVQNWSKMSKDEIQTMAYNSAREGRNNGRPFVLFCSSPFLKKLIERASRLWVDIEADYYDELKRIIGIEDNPVAKENALNRLNASFEGLKFHLVDYLKNIEKPELRNEIIKLFTEPIDLREIPLFPKRSFQSSSHNEKVENYLFVNFNYTPTVKSYLEEISRTKGYINPKDNLINIHGSINDLNNPIIFGFGDDFDEDYQYIEDEEIKGFRDNIKSYLYSMTENYHQVYRFIKSGDFQVFILGHSCGLSDRTMLNMIFEDANCKSIKIFYHGTELSNNHFVLVQQLGRNFVNDKASMRLKVVAKNKSRQLLSEYPELSTLD